MRLHCCRAVRHFEDLPTQHAELKKAHTNNLASVKVEDNTDLSPEPQVLVSVSDVEGCQSRYSPELSPALRFTFTSDAVPAKVYVSYKTSHLPPPPLCLRIQRADIGSTATYLYPRNEPSCN